MDTPPAPAGEVSDKFLLILPVLDGVGAKKGLAQAAHRDFMTELAALQADLNYLSSEAENHRVRATTVAGRLKEYRELKAKAEVYAELLDMQGEKILSLLQNLTSEATRLLDSVAEPMPSSRQPTTATKLARFECLGWWAVFSTNPKCG